MAISARFSADFSSFFDAVSKAEIELRGFEGSAGKVESALSRMTDNFSGRKIISDATLMAQAVENVGGVTKLTAAELQKVGAQAQEAAAKFRAWGQDVPPKIQAIADSVKNVESSTASLGSQLNTLAGAFGVTLGAAGLVGFAKSLLDTGDELVRVADRTGLTTTEVQKLQYIAGQSGNTIDELTGAIGKLQKNLTLGDQGAVAAVHQLGLNLEDLKAASPYDQMAAIATAIEKVPDPAERATLAIQLFGKGGAAILPTLVAQFKELGDAAPVMSDKTVRALDTAGDSLKRFGDQITVWAAEAYNTAGRGFDRLTAGALEFAGKLMPGVTNSQLLSDTAKQLRSHLDDTETAIRKTATAVGDFEPQVAKATKAVKEHDAAVIGLGEGEKTLAGTLQLQQKMFQAYYERLEQIIPAQRDWWTLLPQVNGEIDILASHNLPAATGAVANLGSGVVHLGDQLNQAGAKVVSFGDIFKDTLSDVPKLLTSAFTGGGNLVGAVEALGTQLGSKLGEKIGKGVAALGSLGGPIGEAIGSLAGPLIGLLAKIGGPSKDELAARDTFAKQFKSTADAIDQVGSAYARMGKSGDEAQTDLKRLFDATHVSAAAEADALQIINDKMAAGDLRASDLATGVNGITAAAAQLPGGLTANISGSIEALTHLAGITDEEKGKLLGLVNDTKPNWDALQTTADKYGLSLAALGPAFAQGELDTKAGKLFDDFQQLTSAGADVGGTLDGMKGSWNDYVASVLANHADVPKALEPILQNLVDAGDLTDISGAKLKDLSGIKFADKPLSTGVDNLVLAIQKLIDKLSTDLPNAINNLPKLPAFPTSAGGSDTSNPYGSTGGVVTPMGIQHFAGGGMVLPFRGTDTVPAMLTPGEVVLTKAQQAGMGGPVVVENHLLIELDGHQLEARVTKLQNDRYTSRRKVRAA
jgi:hypothetical protein